MRITEVYQWSQSPHIFAVVKELDARSKNWSELGRRAGIYFGDPNSGFLGQLMTSPYVPTPERPSLLQENIELLARGVNDNTDPDELEDDLERFMKRIREEDSPKVRHKRALAQIARFQAVVWLSRYGESAHLIINRPSDLPLRGLRLVYKNKGFNFKHDQKETDLWQGKLEDGQLRLLEQSGRWVEHVLRDANTGRIYVVHFGALFVKNVHSGYKDVKVSLGQPKDLVEAHFSYVRTGYSSGETRMSIFLGLPDGFELRLPNVGRGSVPTLRENDALEEVPLEQLGVDPLLLYDLGFNMAEIQRRDFSLCEDILGHRL